MMKGKKGILVRRCRWTEGRRRSRGLEARDGLNKVDRAGFAFYGPSITCFGLPLSMLVRDGNPLIPSLAGPLAVSGAGLCLLPSFQAASCRSAVIRLPNPSKSASLPVFLANPR